MKKKEAWQIKHDYKMSDGSIIHCIYQKAWRKLNSGKYGEGNLEEIKGEE